MVLRTRTRHDPTSEVELAFVRHLFGEFVSQRTVRCLREERGTLAVAVSEDMPPRYQIHCSACAWHSTWFEADAGQLYAVHARDTVRMAHESRR
jgi:hypothetical protein